MNLSDVIGELKQQCDEYLNATQTHIDGLYCPGLFDGWTCWSDTPAGVDASQSCPSFIVGFDSNRTAYRRCEPNGEWFFHTEFNKTWSNYTTCVNIEELTFRQLINFIYSVGYSISLVALIVSLALLTYFRSLRCARITVHMNLFASFAVNNFLWLLWYNLVVDSVEVVSHNELWCVLLHVILMYFLISNYSWMLCEGLYLHTVLVSAFVSESRLLHYMLLVGWGLPAITIILYATLRGVYGEGENVSCWMDDTTYNLILQVPVVGTVGLNFLFLFNILRVLCTKLKKAPHTGSGASRASLQALRATLLLVPLLGLNYLLTPFRPEKNHPWEYGYEVLSAVTASLQVCVSSYILYQILHYRLRHETNKSLIKTVNALYVGQIKCSVFTGADLLTRVGRTCFDPLVPLCNFILNRNCEACDACILYTDNYRFPI